MPIKFLLLGGGSGFFRRGGGSANFIFMGVGFSEKRQFDKWYPIHACTPPPPDENLVSNTLAAVGKLCFFFVGLSDGAMDSIFLPALPKRTFRLGCVWETDFFTISTGKKPALVMIFLENTREFSEIITSTGAKFWLRFCLSVLVLIIFQSPSVFNARQQFTSVSETEAEHRQKRKTKRSSPRQ